MKPTFKNSVRRTNYDNWDHIIQMYFLMMIRLVIMINTLFISCRCLYLADVCSLPLCYILCHNLYREVTVFKQYMIQKIHMGSKGFFPSMLSRHHWYYYRHIIMINAHQKFFCCVLL